MPDLKIALIVPCHNESVAIEKVITDFRNVMAGIVCYVFDNNSTDNTAKVASLAGAEVRHVQLKGKGNVVRRMFADVDADIYIMVDGDATYDANSAPLLIQTLIDGDLDMVVGRRVSTQTESYRLGHQFGNKLLTGVVGFIFGNAFDDMLSGYRVFSRRFVKSFPAHSSGFEIETELAVHALELRMAVAEVQTPYGARIEGSVSKLNTYRDGWRILMTILKLFKVERPLTFFSIGFFVCLLAALFLFVPLMLTFIETGLVPRLPTAVLCASIALLGFLLLICGLIMDGITLARIEAKRFSYLQIPSVRSATEQY
jgi:glycosyltransferase involved in cell wall biosynthesis